MQIQRLFFPHSVAPTLSFSGMCTKWNKNCVANWFKSHFLHESNYSCCRWCRGKWVYSLFACVSMYISRGYIVAVGFIHLFLSLSTSNTFMNRKMKTDTIEMRMVQLQSWSNSKFSKLLTLMKQSPFDCCVCVRSSYRFVSFLSPHSTQFMWKLGGIFFPQPVKIHHFANTFYQVWSYFELLLCMLLCLRNLRFRWTYFVVTLFFFSPRKIDDEALADTRKISSRKI